MVRAAMPSMPRGEVLVALGVPQRLVDHAALDLVHRRADGDHDLRGRAHRPLAHRLGQVVHLDDVAAAEHHRALDGVLQLAHVAGPGVVLEHAAAASSEKPRTALRVLRRVALQEVLGEQRNVLAPRGQRGDAHLDHVEAVVEVLAEAALLHLALQVLVGGGDEPHVDLDGLGAAEPLDLALLQHAQQLHLRRGRSSRPPRRGRGCRRWRARSGPPCGPPRR